MTNPLADTASTVPSPARTAGLCRFSVRAVADPSVLSRVLELFALRDLLPERMHSERRPGEDGIGIDLEVRGLTVQQADHLACRMRAFPTVTGVLLHRE